MVPTRHPITWAAGHAQHLSRGRAALFKPVVYVNQVGGNDQLVFDGTSSR
jgi:hypothetical protein